jgi:putative ABC transport system ATP-binding protein
MNENSQKTPPLRVENVRKVFYQGTTPIEALKNVSQTIEQGDFVAVMGASGSGKSTLLHVIAGLTRPEAGNVFVDGENIATMTDYELTLFRRRRIGLVFQSFNLIPTLSAEDNILLPLLADGRAEAANGRLDDLLQRLGLADRRHHRPDALSGGEQQRVAIARALITDPSIVLADEPTGSLDSVSGQTLCKILREICRAQGRTIVVVTHEPSVAVWAKRVVVLKDGMILSQFPTDEFHDAHSLAARYQEIVDGAATVEVPR